MNFSIENTDKAKNRGQTYITFILIRRTKIKLLRYICLHHCFTNTHHTFIHKQLRSPNQRCSATCNPLGPCFSSPLTLVLLRHQLTLHVEECLPNLHAGVHDKLTYVRYYLSDALVANLFLLPPPLCFLELAPAVAESDARSKVLASVVSTY